MPSTNIYDYINFPEKAERDAIRKNYKEIENLRGIEFNISERYKNKVCPDSFSHYEFVALTWINEFNHYIFLLNIPLLQLAKVKESLDKSETEEERVVYNFFFGYYSEIVANFINIAFQKSLYIYNVLFEFRINNGVHDIREICEAIKKKAPGNLYVDKVNNSNFALE